jgi:hypothetical protein
MARARRDASPEGEALKRAHGKQNRNLISTKRGDTLFVEKENILKGD